MDNNNNNNRYALSTNSVPKNLCATPPAVAMPPAHSLHPLPACTPDYPVLLWFFSHAPQTCIVQRSGMA